MSTHPDPPVQRALEKLRALSADAEARYWAEAREKAIKDEVSLLEEAREEVARKAATRYTGKPRAICCASASCQTRRSRRSPR